MSFIPLYLFADKNIYVIAKSGLNIRSNDDLNSKILGKFVFCEKPNLVEIKNKHEVINNIEGYWVKVKKNEVNGFIFSGYLGSNCIFYNNNEIVTFFAIENNLIIPILNYNLKNKNIQDSRSIYSPNKKLQLWSIKHNIYIEPNRLKIIQDVFTDENFILPYVEKIPDKEDIYINKNISKFNFTKPKEALMKSFFYYFSADDWGKYFVKKEYLNYNSTKIEKLSGLSILYQSSLEGNNNHELWVKYKLIHGEFGMSVFQYKNRNWSTVANVCINCD